VETPKDVVIKTAQSILKYGTYLTQKNGVPALPVKNGVKLISDLGERGDSVVT
jgi:hypothetical protein